MLRLINLLNGNGTGTPPDTNTGDASDAGFSDVLEILEGVVDNTIIPILYAVLGLFLVVKGALLGMQIVKAADEPQVRQEKISSLKWLVIGCAIAFGVVFASDMLISYFAKTFNQSDKVL